MADSALEILPLETAKLQLRLDGDDYDELVTVAIKNAVSYISTLTGLPLIAKDLEVYRCRPLIDDGPIQFYFDFNQSIIADFKAVNSVKYLTVDQKQREAPKGSIDPATLGDVRRSDTLMWIYPPEQGWPEVLYGTKFLFNIRLEYDNDEAKDAIAQAVTLMTRQFFDNPQQWESTFAVKSLIDPFRRMVV